LARLAARRDRARLDFLVLLHQGKRTKELGIKAKERNNNLPPEKMDYLPSRLFPRQS